MRPSSKTTPGKIRPRIRVETLESRALMSNAPALTDLAVLSASQRDAQSVVVNYEVRDAALTAPLSIKVFRSSIASTNGPTELIGSATIRPSGESSPTLDLLGRPVGDIGTHSIAIDTGEAGLRIDPSHPFVVVSANSDHATPEANYSNNSASYRSYTIAAISHGGKQPGKWGDKGPPWENKMARSLLAEGYDVVIPFNWVKSSSTPGSAKGVAPYLLKKITDSAAILPQTTPVNLHLIGHSEGAVVNSEVLKKLTAAAPPNIQAGFVKETMLDPHAASNAFQGPQFSVSSGPLGSVASREITHYQSRANDPLVTVPAIVDQAEVFYQHTPVNQTHSSNSGIYNLWGQVPIIGVANYYDITASGVSHAGTYGVFDWYQQHVVPGLSSGGSNVSAQTVSIEEIVNQNAAAVTTVSGQAPPGSKVILKLIGHSPNLPSANDVSHVVGRTTAAADGSWTVTGANRSLAQTTAYVASARLPRTADHSFLPMLPKAIVASAALQPAPGSSS